jgi:DNA polymerase-3 subunit epsilon
MQKVYRELTDKFRKQKGVISSSTFNKIVSKLDEDSKTSLLLLQASGYPIKEVGKNYILETYKKDYKNQKFCVIDIETNGSKPNEFQVIEIGAIMLQNGKIIDRFESLVKCNFIPEYITKITGITTKNLKDAPSNREVLEKFRIFLDNAIFVAHNVDFDFNFLNSSFKNLGLGSIGNFKMCSIDLAKRTIDAKKYGLAHLNEILNLGIETHHRAFSDALTTAKLLNILLKKIPKNIKTTDELIRFSKSNIKNK